jgi:hypothetical protein
MKSQYRKVLDQLNLSSDAELRLSRILDKTVAGNSDVIITPIGKAHNPDEILSRWDKIFESKRDLFDDGLLAFELNNRSKYGPRSIAKPWVDRKASLYDSFAPDENKITLPGVELGNRLRPLSKENAMKYLKNKTSSGLPFLTKKDKVKPTLLQDYGMLLERKDPCVLFTRTQEGNKTRNVWGYPIADTLNEMCYYRPLLDYQSQLSWRSSITLPEKVDASVISLMKQAKAEDKFLVSIDFSSYDNTIRRTLMEGAFNYIKSLFQSSYHEEIDYIKERMISIGIVTPDGVLDGDHGVPSGSTFTNEVDSIVQYLISLSYQAEQLELQQIQGDDGIYSCSNPDDLLAHFKSYGLNVNDDKSDSTKDYCLFLQKYYSHYYIDKGIVGGIYPTYRALVRLVYPERFIDFTEELSGKDYFAIRTLSILENCKNHPLYRDLVEFVMSLEKYSLIPSEEGLRGYVKFRERQDGEDVNFNVHQYGNSTSIKDFETYKLVKSMS